MIKILSLLIIFSLGSVPTSLETLRWGQTGHRTVGLIAEQHLSAKAAEQVKRILGQDSMAEVSNWMDDIKSDRAYDYMSPWHYVTILKGHTYETSQKAPEGDIIWAIEKVVSELKEGGLSPEQERENLKILIHLVGDLHQPLHVGDRDDRGGNSVRLQWFSDNSNLHRVWDSDMINQKQLSFTELAQFVNQPRQAQIAEWQSGTVTDWAHEAQTLFERVYDLPDNKRLGYEYTYKNWSTVETQLAKAGIRLAGLLNQIFD